MATHHAASRVHPSVWNTLEVFPASTIVFRAIPHWTKRCEQIVHRLKICGHDSLFPKIKTQERNTIKYYIQNRLFSKTFYIKFGIYLRIFVVYITYIYIYIYIYIYYIYIYYIYIIYLSLKSSGGWWTTVLAYIPVWFIYNMYIYIYMYIL